MERKNGRITIKQAWDMMSPHLFMPSIADNYGLEFAIVLQQLIQISGHTYHEDIRYRHGKAGVNYSTKKRFICN